MTGYLRNSNVRIRIHIERNPALHRQQSFLMEIQQTLRIERPWFAFTPVFYAIAKSSALSGFEKAANSIARDYSQKMEKQANP
jgi:hypothetical protein